MQLVNYHTHTPLCCHATGAPEDYIEEALACGLIELGFSDHAPLPLPQREGITMEPGQTEDYIAMIEAARARYEGRIAVKLGFEVDYPLFGTFDAKYLSDPRIDYLIGSCHFLGNWAFDHPGEVHEFDNRDIDDVYSDYYRILESLVESRIFQILGHFDLVKKFGHRPQKNFSPQVEKLAISMAAYGMAAEINTSGLLKPVGEMYPSDEIIRILFSCNVPVTLGCDAHSPGLVANHLREAVETLRKIGYRKISGFTKKRRYDIPL